MNASPFGRAVVESTPEIERIAALPRRVWTDEAARELAVLLTRELKTPRGTMELRPVQAVALYEAMECGGLFGPIRVGGGKTLITLLLPLVLEAKRPVLLLPATLVDKTWHDRKILAEHWRLPTNLQIISYELLGLVQSAEKLEYIRPDWIITDECFVAGTPIRTAKGIRPIETVCFGDFVETGEGLYPVTGAWSQESEDLYDVAFGDRRYTCTGGHPFLTTKGWRATRDLVVGDEVVRDVQTTLRFETLQEEYFLLSQVQVRQSEDQSTPVRERESSEGGRRAFFFESRVDSPLDQEADAHAGSTRSGSARAPSARQLETSGTGRQRASDAETPTDASGSTWSGLGFGETLSLGTVSDTGVSSGHGSRGVQARGGGRRGEPQQRESERREEGSFLGGARVARVTSVQRRGSGTPGSRARVYNLSVDGPETYVLGGGEIVHNCFFLKNLRAGRTRRVARYMDKYPETGFVALAGTVMKGSVRDFAHLLRWSLKKGAPIPATDEEVESWADALDERVNPLARRRPEALLRLAGLVDAGLRGRRDGSRGDRGKELAELIDVLERDDVAEARRAFQSRLLETRGVVASPRNDGVACSLRVSALEYQPSAITEQHIGNMRHGVKDAHGKYVVRPWTTPDGWAFANPIEFRMYLRQLALGFHGVWDPRPPQEWVEARRDWATFVRETLEESQHLDTELQVANEVDAGRLSTITLDRWRAVRDTFTIQPKDVWHDDAALEACAAWMEERKGIVWCEHRFFAHKLAAMTGAAYYGANGLSERGDSITVVKPGRAIIASVQANSAGRNLQMFSTNLVTSCPPSGQTVEQLIGRTHRDGQEADEVTADVLLGCREHHDAFQRALDSARAAADTLGHEQKLLLADVVMPDISGRRGPLWQ